MTGRSFLRAMAAAVSAALLVTALAVPMAAQETDEVVPPQSVDTANAADMIMQAWAPEYDEAKVDAIYHPEVLMMLDTDVLAADREEIKSVISGALGMGNRYTQVGPVIPYESDDGDLYLASLVEVRGVGHKTGDPVVGFYRVRDGKVDRHIFIYAPDY